MTSCHDELTHPALVAHRGYAKHYPENTLVSIRAALDAGIGAVEFDVQLTADRVPVVLHDASLRRTAGVDREIFDLPLARAREIDVGEPQRFGAAFAGVTLPTLAETVELLGRGRTRRRSSNSSGRAWAVSGSPRWSTACWRTCGRFSNGRW